jgi:predicted aspartyl protease
MFSHRWFGIACLAVSAAHVVPAGTFAAETSFAVSKYGELMVVPVYIGDRKILCLVDTGASNNVFDIELQSVLGAPQGTMLLKMSSGERRVPYFHAPATRLGEIELSRDEIVACLDLSVLRKHMGVDVRGVLGMSALRAHIVRFDFDRGLLEILKQGAEEPANWGRPVPLRADADGLVYHAALQVGGVDCEFLVDTGASMVTIDRSTADRLVRRSEAHYMLHASSFQADGEHRKPVYGLPRLAIGPYTHHCIPLWQSGERKLGLSLLSCYQVVFDFPGCVMYLKPGSRFGEDESVETAGLEIDRRNDVVVAAYVWKSGAAGRAGLRAGDRIDRVGDREASSYELDELRHLFGSADQSPIPIMYSRAGRLRRTTLVVDDPTIGTATSGMVATGPRPPLPTNAQPTTARSTTVRTVAPVRRLFRR